MSLEGGKLICINEDESRGEIIGAKGRKFTIGYYMSCDYVVKDARAEAVHCEIQCDAFGRVTIHNMSEKHPICVNDKPISMKRPLLSGTQIKILDKKFIWEFVKSTSAEYEDLNCEQVSTPQKQIGIPEQPPNSCPDFKLHREVMKRFTVHNFGYNIQSDDEGNTSAESSSMPGATQEVRTPSEENLANKADDTETDSQNMPLIHTTPANDSNIINATENKENAKSPIKLQLLSLCERSEIVMTSFSPRVTGVRPAKSFTALYKSKTPKSAYSTPKGVSSDTFDDASELIDFSTPATSKKTNSSMHLIDLTTPGKLRPGSPYHKSALKHVNKKANDSKSIPKMLKEIPEDGDLGVKPLPTTPIVAAIGSNTNTPSTIGSVISVDSTATASVIEVTSDESTTAEILTRTPAKTPTKTVIMAKATTTPKRTPQSLMKRALLTSAKKQDSAFCSATPRRLLSVKKELHGTPRTPENSVDHLSQHRRQSLSTPAHRSLAATRFDISAATTSRAGIRRSSLIPPINSSNAMTSTPLVQSTRRLRLTGKTSPLHKTRKSLALTKAKVRTSTSPIAISNKLVAKARKSYCTTTPSMRQGRGLAGKITPASILKDTKDLINNKTAMLSKKAVLFESSETPQLERQGTFTVEGAKVETNENVADTQNPKNATFTPKKDTDNDRLLEENVLDKTFSPVKLPESKANCSSEDVVDDATYSKMKDSLEDEGNQKTVDDCHVVPDTEDLLKQIDDVLHKSDYLKKLSISREDISTNLETTNTQKNEKELLSQESVHTTTTINNVNEELEDELLKNIDETLCCRLKEVTSSELLQDDPEEMQNDLNSSATNITHPVNKSGETLTTIGNADQCEEKHAVVEQNDSKEDKKNIDEDDLEQEDEVLIKVEQLYTTVTEKNTLEEADSVKEKGDSVVVQETVEQPPISSAEVCIVVEEPSEPSEDVKIQQNTSVTFEIVDDDEYDDNAEQQKQRLCQSQPIIELADESNEEIIPETQETTTQNIEIKDVSETEPMQNEEVEQMSSTVETKITTDIIKDIASEVASSTTTEFIKELDGKQDEAAILCDQEIINAAIVDCKEEVVIDSTTDMHEGVANEPEDSDKAQNVTETTTTPLNSENLTNIASTIDVEEEVKCSVEIDNANKINDEITSSTVVDETINVAEIKISDAVNMENSSKVTTSAEGEIDNKQADQAVVDEVEGDKLNLIVSQSTTDEAAAEDHQLANSSDKSIQEHATSILLADDDALAEVQTTTPIKVDSTTADTIPATKTPNLCGVRELLQTPKIREHFEDLTGLFSTPMPSKVLTANLTSNEEIIENITEDIGGVVVGVEEFVDSSVKPGDGDAAEASTAKITTDADVVKDDNQKENVAPIYEDISEVIEESICEEINNSEFDEKLEYNDNDDDVSVVIDDKNEEAETIEVQEEIQEDNVALEQSAELNFEDKSEILDVTDYDYGKELVVNPESIASCKAETTAIQTPKSTKRVKIEEPSPRTPVMIGMRELLKTPKVYPKTPKMIGLRDLVLTPKAQTDTADNFEIVATPQGKKIHSDDDDDNHDNNEIEKNIKATESNVAENNAEFLGISEMLKTPKGCSTPRFKGLREKVQTPKQCSTPNMGGLKNLMDTPTLGTPISRIAADNLTSTTFKQDLTVGHADLESNQTETEGLDKFFRTPRAKNIMIPSEPASAVLKTDSESVELVHSTEYSLNDTATQNLEDIFKTPVATRFAERLADTIDDDDEHNSLVREQQNVETAESSKNLSAEEAFDKMIGQASSIETPARKVYARKSLEQTANQSPFSASDVISDLPKTDVQEWVDSLESADLPNDTFDEDCLNLNQTEIEDVTLATAKDTSSDPLKNNSAIDTAEKQQTNDITTASDVMVDVSVVSENDDPLASSIVKDAIKAAGTSCVVEEAPADISGINLLDQTDGSVFSEPLLLSDTDSLNRTMENVNDVIDEDAKSATSTTQEVAAVDTQSKEQNNAPNYDEVNLLSEPLLLSGDSLNPVADTTTAELVDKTSEGENEIVKENVVAEVTVLNEQTEDKSSEAIGDSNISINKLKHEENSHPSDSVSENSQEILKTSNKSVLESTQDGNDVDTGKDEAVVENPDNVETKLTTEKYVIPEVDNNTTKILHENESKTEEEKPMLNIESNATSLSKESNEQKVEGVEAETVISNAAIITTDYISTEQSLATTRRKRKASSSSQLSDTSETNATLLTPRRTRKASQSPDTNVTQARRTRRKLSATEDSKLAEEPKELEIIPEEVTKTTLAAETETEIQPEKVNAKNLKEELLSMSTPQRKRRDSQTLADVCGSTPLRRSRRKSSTAEVINDQTSEPNKVIAGLKIDTPLTGTPRRTRRASLSAALDSTTPAGRGSRRSSFASVLEEKLDEVEQVQVDFETSTTNTENKTSINPTKPIEYIVSSLKDTTAVVATIESEQIAVDKSAEQISDENPTLNVECTEAVPKQTIQGKSVDDAEPKELEASIEDTAMSAKISPLESGTQTQIKVEASDEPSTSTEAKEISSVITVDDTELVAVKIVENDALNKITTESVETTFKDTLTTDETINADAIPTLTTKELVVKNNSSTVSVDEVGIHTTSEQSAKPINDTLIAAQLVEAVEVQPDTIAKVPEVEAENVENNRQSSVDALELKQQTMDKIESKERSSVEKVEEEQPSKEKFAEVEQTSVEKVIENKQTQIDKSVAVEEILEVKESSNEKVVEAEQTLVEDPKLSLAQIDEAVQPSIENAIEDVNQLSTEEDEQKSVQDEQIALENVVQLEQASVENKQPPIDNVVIEGEKSPIQKNVEEQQEKVLKEETSSTEKEVQNEPVLEVEKQCAKKVVENEEQELPIEKVIDEEQPSTEKVLEEKEHLIVKELVEQALTKNEQPPSVSIEIIYKAAQSSNEEVVEAECKSIENAMEDNKPLIEKVVAEQAAFVESFEKIEKDQLSTQNVVANEKAAIENKFEVEATSESIEKEFEDDRKPIETVVTEKQALIKNVVENEQSTTEQAAAFDEQIDGEESSIVKAVAAEQALIENRSPLDEKIDEDEQKSIGEELEVEEQSIEKINDGEQGSIEKMLEVKEQSIEQVDVEQASIEKVTKEEQSSTSITDVIEDTESLIENVVEDEQPSIEVIQPSNEKAVEFDKEESIEEVLEPKEQSIEEVVDEQTSIEKLTEAEQTSTSIESIEGDEKAVKTEKASNEDDKPSAEETIVDEEESIKEELVKKKQSIQEVVDEQTSIEKLTEAEQTSTSTEKVIESDEKAVDSEKASNEDDKPSAKETIVDEDESIKKEPVKKEQSIKEVVDEQTSIEKLTEAEKTSTSSEKVIEGDEKAVDTEKASNEDDQPSVEETIVDEEESIKEELVKKEQSIQEVVAEQTSIEKLTEAEKTSTSIEKVIEGDEKAVDTEKASNEDDQPSVEETIVDEEESIKEELVKKEQSIEVVDAKQTSVEKVTEDEQPSTSTEKVVADAKPPVDNVVDDGLVSIEMVEPSIDKIVKDKQESIENEKVIVDEEPSLEKAVEPEQASIGNDLPLIEKVVEAEDASIEEQLKVKEQSGEESIENVTEDQPPSTSIEKIMEEKEPSSEKMAKDDSKSNEVKTPLIKKYFEDEKESLAKVIEGEPSSIKNVLKVNQSSLENVSEIVQRTDEMVVNENTSNEPIVEKVQKGKTVNEKVLKRKTVKKNLNDKKTKEPKSIETNLEVDQEDLKAEPVESEPLKKENVFEVIENDGKLIGKLSLSSQKHIKPTDSTIDEQSTHAKNIKNVVTSDDDVLEVEAVEPLSSATLTKQTTKSTEEREHKPTAELIRTELVENLQKVSPNPASKEDHEDVLSTKHKESSDEKSDYEGIDLPPQVSSTAASEKLRITKSIVETTKSKRIRKASQPSHIVVAPAKRSRRKASSIENEDEQKSKESKSTNNLEDVPEEPKSAEEPIESENVQVEAETAKTTTKGGTYKRKGSQSSESSVGTQIRVRGKRKATIPETSEESKPEEESKSQEQNHPNKMETIEELKTEVDASKDQEPKLMLDMKVDDAVQQISKVLDPISNTATAQKPSTTDSTTHAIIHVQTETSATKPTADEPQTNQSNQIYKPINTEEALEKDEPKIKTTTAARTKRLRKIVEEMPTDENKSIKRRRRDRKNTEETQVTVTPKSNIEETDEAADKKVTESIACEVKEEEVIAEVAREDEASTTTATQLAEQQLPPIATTTAGRRRARKYAAEMIVQEEKQTDLNKIETISNDDNADAAEDKSKHSIETVQQVTETTVETTRSSKAAKVRRKRGHKQSNDLLEAGENENLHKESKAATELNLAVASSEVVLTTTTTLDASPEIITNVPVQTAMPAKRRGRKQTAESQPHEAVPTTKRGRRKPHEIDQHNEAVAEENITNEAAAKDETVDEVEKATTIETVAVAVTTKKTTARKPRQKKIEQQEDTQMLTAVDTQVQAHDDADNDSIKSKVSARKRKESHTETEEESLERNRKNPHDNLDATPQRKPVARRGLKGSSTMDAPIDETPSKTPLSQKREGRNIPRRNYDESSDNEIPIELKRRPSKGHEGVESVAATLAPDTPSTTRIGRQRKPTARVQQYLEEERARATTPKKRVLLEESKTVESPKTIAKVETPLPTTSKRAAVGGRRGGRNLLVDEPTSSEVDEEHNVKDKSPIAIAAEIIEVPSAKTSARGRVRGKAKGKQVAENDGAAEHSEEAQATEETEVGTAQNVLAVAATGKRGAKTVKVHVDADMTDEEEDEAEKVKPKKAARGRGVATTGRVAASRKRKVSESKSNAADHVEAHVVTGERINEHSTTTTTEVDEEEDETEKVKPKKTARGRAAASASSRKRKVSETKTAAAEQGDAHVVTDERINEPTTTTTTEVVEEKDEVKPKKTARGRGGAATGRGAASRKRKVSESKIAAAEQSDAHVVAETEEDDVVVHNREEGELPALPVKRTAAVIAALRTADDSPIGKRSRGRKANVADSADDLTPAATTATRGVRGARGAGAGVGSRKVRFGIADEASATPNDAKADNDANPETESPVAAPELIETATSKTAAPSKRGARMRRK